MKQIMDNNDENLPHSVALHTNAVLQAGQRVEHELQQVKRALEDKTKQLDESLSILRATIESTADGILVTDEYGHMLRYNERYLQMWQIQLPNLVEVREHRQLQKLSCRYLADPKQYFERIEEIYATWPAETYDLLELTDGRVFERFSKIQYLEGLCVGRIWSFRDITARKHAEEALQESTERLRFMAEAMPQKVFTARADGAVDYFNQQWKDYTGLAPEKMQGWEWTKLIHADDVAEGVQRWQHSLNTGEPLHMECRFRQANGTYRWHLLQAQARRDAKGYISMWVGSNTDIDTLKRANDEKKQLLENERIARSEAERSNRIKDDFLATLSHELRTPLNAILGWSQLILQGTMKKEDIQRGLEAIERNARAQNKLIEDLLEMSSIISGKIRLDVQELDLSAIIEAAVESVAPAAEAKGICIRETIDATAGRVLGDNHRLQQIIWNLLSNAVKFTSKGGTIEVTVQPAASQLEIIVKDSGVGIKTEFLAYVFDRFRQADSSITRNHGGLGLGLAIVKQLVELHGGTVRAESEGEGHGASFIVTLPLAPVEDDKEKQQLPAATLSVKRDGSSLLSGMRILVIDDDRDARELIHKVLAQHQAEIITAANAMEGLLILKSQMPDVMISDIGMPGKDGYQFIREVRRLPAIQGGETPAIALSAFAHSEDRARARMAGYQVHLSKPVESKELIASIGSLMARAKTASS
ncbi:PAS/PAC sensor hybrid histidine kinase [Nitrosospira multiformis]|uniref:Virulence sensor protein BvgS n=2 Tax=Nitrosospira multiformis TaxID=1231 RepID=A0A1I7H1Y0_9PROT|nr:PAS/PAC sensor hybrid histidine kinase [Nitrosospira multiformis]